MQYTPGFLPESGIRKSKETMTGLDCEVPWVYQKHNKWYTHGFV